MGPFALALASLTIATSAFADVSVGATNLPGDSSIISKRARLPEIPLTDVDLGATSGNIGYESSLSISPDERFIFRDQKLYRGGGAAYRYTRVHGLIYRPAAHARIDRAVKRFFARQVGGREIEQMATSSSWRGATAASHSW